MATEMVPLSGLARRLVDDGLMEMNAASDAASAAREAGIPFVSYLVQNKVAEPRDVAVSASEEFGVPLIDLAAFDPEAIPRDLVKERLIRAHNALPLIRRGVRLFVAVSDPTNLQGLDEIKFQSGTNTEPVLVEEDKLAVLIEQHLNAGEGDALGDLDDDELVDLDMESFDEGSPEEEDTSSTDETPIVRFVNKMLLDAIKTGASARLKVMSQLDISERRIPQDGRIKMKLSKTKAIDFRVNTLPTLWGEKIVLRILDPSSAQMGIEMLGFEPDQREHLEWALPQPQGMILVTGPTGSGKTVTLYTGLNMLNTQERNIATAEDPVEINLEGINQVNVNHKVGLDFASALRSFLRQDPDVVMVGEIRDLETAEISIKAAQTGHMVLSTLHTNSAAETLTRLRNMGVPAFNLATSVTLIIAQRLARRLCTNCKTKIDVPAPALKEEGFTDEDIASGFEVFGPNTDGCDSCSSGYKGRVGIYEVVKITPELSLGKTGAETRVQRPAALIPRKSYARGH